MSVTTVRCDVLERADTVPSIPRYVPVPSTIRPASCTGPPGMLDPAL
jgi:hypothetical protein